MRNRSRSDLPTAVFCPERGRLRRTKLPGLPVDGQVFAAENEAAENTGQDASLAMCQSVHEDCGVYLRLPARLGDLAELAMGQQCAA